MSDIGINIGELPFLGEGDKNYNLWLNIQQALIDEFRQRAEYVGALTSKQKLIFNMGPTGAISISGSEFTNLGLVAHGLGVVPIFAIVLNWSEDSGIFNTYVDWGSTTSTNIGWAAQDTRHLPHGPGNLAGSRFLAIGIV